MTKLRVVKGIWEVNVKSTQTNVIWFVETYLKHHILLKNICGDFLKIIEYINKTHLVARKLSYHIKKDNFDPKTEKKTSIQ